MYLKLEDVIDVIPLSIPKIMNKEIWNNRLTAALKSGFGDLEYIYVTFTLKDRISRQIFIVILQP